MSKKKCVVKRKGKEENFDERKVYASCYAACLSTKMKEERAEKICEKVSSHIKKLIGKKLCVSSDIIFKKTAEFIEKYDKDAAFMYKSHRDIG